jgi:hypothetical protein
MRYGVHANSGAAVTDPAARISSHLLPSSRHVPQWRGSASETSTGNNLSPPALE